jgi:hypothetical protein
MERNVIEGRQLELSLQSLPSSHISNERPTIEPWRHKTTKVTPIVSIDLNEDKQMIVRIRLKVMFRDSLLKVEQE